VNESFIVFLAPPTKCCFLALYNLTFNVSFRKKKVVGLEWGPLSLMSTTEELLDRKVAAPVSKTENMAVGIRHADHVAPSIRKSWQSLLKEAAVARSV
jgi:hypothetical protein